MRDESMGTRHTRVAASRPYPISTSFLSISKVLAAVSDHIPHLKRQCYGLLDRLWRYFLYIRKIPQTLPSHTFAARTTHPRYLRQIDHVFKPEPAAAFSVISIFINNFTAGTHHEVHIFFAVARLHSILPCPIGLHDTTKLPQSACIDPVQHKHYCFFASRVRTLQTLLRPCISTLNDPFLPTARLSSLKDGEKIASNLVQRESDSPFTYNSTIHYHSTRCLRHFFRIWRNSSQRLCYPIYHSTHAELVRR